MDSVACRCCDLLQRVPPLPRGGKARCVRCGQLLATRPADPLDAPLALTIAAAIAFAVANATPMLRLSAEGREAQTTLPGGALAMWHAGSELTALAVAFCAVVAPACHLALLLAVLLAVRRPPAPPWVGVAMRWLERVRPWAMTEVLLLGVLVALTKIAQLASVAPGPGLFALLAVVLLVPAIATTFDADLVWRRIAWADARAQVRA
ncbi:MAG: paraquat-inducible protein A [Burkholderiales bacterium]|nr:paraquat-inducible protein A [Burkholderiales bacterium]